MYEENLQNDAAVDDDDGSVCKYGQLQQQRRCRAGVCADGVNFFKTSQGKASTPFVLLPKLRQGVICPL